MGEKIMEITIQEVKMTFDKKTRKIGWMSNWRRCWELARDRHIESNYYENLYGHVDFFVPENLMEENNEQKI